MPRRNRRSVGAVSARVVGSQQREDWRGVAYAVRTVPGAAAVKVYRCPGCQQEVRIGTPHVVVWPADDQFSDLGTGDRRHWHGGCWTARDRRGPM